MPHPIWVRRSAIVFSAASALIVASLPFPSGVRAADDAYQPPNSGYGGYTPPRGDAYDPNAAPQDAAPPYRPGGVYGEDDSDRRYDGPDTAARRPNDGGPGYGEPYHAPGEYDRAPPPDGGPPHEGYSQNEIIGAGHRFFGAVSEGLASVVEYAFQKPGAPTATSWARMPAVLLSRVCATARARSIRRTPASTRSTGRGRRSATTSAARGPRPWCWSTTCATPCEIYERYAGVQGSAYIVGGVGIQFQTHGSVTLAPIRVGHWAQARCQRGVFKVYPGADVEPVLSRRRIGIEALAGEKRGGCIAHDAR